MIQVANTGTGKLEPISPTMGIDSPDVNQPPKGEFSRTIHATSD